ncbi:PHP domain-containing protein [Alkalicoccobacillus murimartini]|uniref:Metal-dependent phosphoesterase TrpH n=1 Tax=Alkalicoccobacillus murimartini TaxID=171685 RepID=A0ABT9YF21_9BACI|nr:PHP domain-containing protein [Alkalicoccobacillus murimartini]MDQ0206218.1 putative metal-dependent phosphoesterase TrpH [Alkalicoccobacillus murimartini]
MKLPGGTDSDFHMHSTASDGGYSPSVLVEKCHAVGLKQIALTDHDTVDGTFEAMKVGERLGVRVLPGIEFSCVFEKKSVHMLGLGVDVHHEAFQQMLSKQRDMRQRRMNIMLQKLSDVGVHVTADEVLAEADGGSIGRPHVAKVLIKHDVVKTVAEAFDRYLAEGKPCYVEKEREMTVKEAIDWTHEVGGLSIVAHPGYYGLDHELIHWITKWGMDGIEVYHRDHEKQDQERYEQICEEAEQVTGSAIFRSGGSDFHHETYGRKQEPLGVTRLQDYYADQIITELSIRQRD